ncbi:hypothetical protein [Pseudanabaena sp. 'Roaring Creek']|uniref:hypothetical protein n=1 Tax=Pseudanabaena sp. 'Roaring Creek' TaxID=1681830 RepID=UPI0006D7ED10|nr:hypothetical protein [Pseudanabaena sp. 'Roaring Creek']
MHSAPVSSPETVKRLSVVLPRDIADEICELPAIAKAMLLLETADDIVEKTHGFPVLPLSATTTQWLKAISKRDQLQLIENLALQLMSEV